MIDETNLTIEQLKDEIQRENRRRYAFQRMLRATDKVLWMLEEMNRDGVKTIAEGDRAEIRETFAELPQECIDIYRDTDRVQEVLDSVFDIQECLFRNRFPEYGFDEDDERQQAV